MSPWRRWAVGLALALGGVLAVATQGAAGMLDASWTAPTTNTDASALTNLASYRVYYGTTNPPCPGATFFTVASATASPAPATTVTFRLTGLVTGTLYYVAVTAVNTGGAESACSTVASASSHVDFTVSPTGTVNYGTVNLGSFADQTFTVTNASTGTVSGTVTAPAPFSVVAGSAFSVTSPGGTQAVTVRFTPTTGASVTSNVNFAADGDTVSRLVTGTTPTLTVTASGTGTGTVTSSPAGINCTTTCAATFTSGTPVTLTATPATGSLFTGWSGGGCSGTGSCIVTVSGATTVTATYTLQTFTLAVALGGAGTGTVASSPGGIACGATCSAGFSYGTPVTLTATPAGGSQFTGWSGGGCSGTGTCVITISAAASVTATFTPVFTLTVGKSGAGTGSVASQPPGITCGATCAATFSAGTVVSLDALAGTNSVFTGWSGGGCSGTGPCVVTMSAAVSVTATFAPTVTLTVNFGFIAGGTVTSAPTGIFCSTNCSAGFASGTSVTLTATPAANATFAGWSGACSGTGTCTTTLTAATTVQANFNTAIPAAITLTVSGRGSATGSIFSSPAGISCGTTCAGVWANGSTIGIYTTVGTGASFKQWGGACTGTGACSVSLTVNKSVTATFSAVYTDASLTGLVVKAVHITELRTAINTLRSQNFRLPAFSFTDSSLSGVVIKAVHLYQLREALNDAYTAAGMPLPTYTDPVVTTIKAVHITELRSAVRALE